MANLTSTTITGNLTVTGSATGVGFESGTKMVFYQASAPTGWTQDTASALSNTVMSVVTGTGGGTGGTTSYFASFLATTNKSAPGQPVSGSVSGTVGGHTLSTPEIASHSHPGSPYNSQGGTGPQRPVMLENNFTVLTLPPTGSAGGGGSHAHPFNGSLSSATADVTIPAADVKYANVIVATKD